MSSQRTREGPALVIGPYSTVLGRVDGIRGYHDTQRYPDARLVPGLVLFRWDAPLFIANAELFHARVLAAAASSPTSVRRVVVTAEPVTSVDVTSGDMLAELVQTLRGSGIELRFAEVKDPVKDKLKRSSCSTAWEPTSSTRPSAPPWTPTSPSTRWTGSPETRMEPFGIRTERDRNAP
jgi:MFS superfamily sulfate permease-like transporter